MKMPLLSRTTKTAALALLSALALSPYTFAQTAQTPTDAPDNQSTPTTPPPNNVITLSPFEVTAEKDQGYISENTLSGSRLNSSLKDTPALVTVFNNELIGDLGVNDLSELVRYDSNVQMESFEGQGATNSNTFNEVNPTQRNSYRSRGLPGSQARDFFLWLAPQDNYNVERVDFSKGPNGVLFGVGALGGTLNSASKRALFNKTSTALSTQAGSWGLLRTTLDTNYIVKKNVLALRLNLSKHQENGYRYDTFKDKDRATLAATFKPFKTTTIRFNGEKGRDKWSNQRPFGVGDGVSEWLQNGSQPATYWNAITNNTERGRAVAPNSTNANAAIQATINQVTQSGFGIRNNTPNIIATQLGDSLQLYNDARAATSTAFNDLQNSDNFRANYSGRLLYDDPEKFGPLSISNRVAPGGPDTWALNEFHSIQVNIEQRITQDLQAELSYFSEQVTSHGQNAGGLSLQADPNPLIGNANGSNDRPFESGTQANPNAGRFYLETNWERHQDERKQNAIRATLAYNLNLPAKLNNTLGRILGHHRLAASVENNNQEVYRLKEKEVLPYSFRTMGMTIAPGTQAPTSNTTHTLGFNRLVPNNAIAGANQINYRNYVTLGDWRNFNAGRMPSGPSTYTFAQVPGSTVASTWVPSSSDAILSTEVTGNAMMLAVQSFFLKNKLVTTVGYRRDLVKTSNIPTALDGVGPAPTYTGVADYDGDGEQYEYVLLNDRHDLTYVRAITRSMGAVLHTTKNLDLFYNASSGTSLPILNQKIGPDGRICPGQTGNNQEFGIQVNLFADKLTARLSRYKTTEENRFFFQLHGLPAMVKNIMDAMQDYIAPNGTPQPLITPTERAQHEITWNGHLGSGSSEGYELQLRFNPSKSITLIGSYSYTDRSLTNVAADIEQYVLENQAFFAEKVAPTGLELKDLLSKNRTPAESMQTEIDRVIGNIYSFRYNRQFGFGEAPHKAVLTGKYTFQNGRLKNLGLGGSAQWQSGAQLKNLLRYTDTNGDFQPTGGTIIRDPNTGALTSLGEFTLVDGHPISDGVIKGPNNLTVDAFITYPIYNLFNNKIDLHLQLNVRNMLNDTDVVPQSMNNAQTGYSQYTYKEPRSYRFTATFKF